MPASDFAVIVEGFFIGWMSDGRKLSQNTVSSYRDAISLFLRWMRDERGVDAPDVCMDDLDAETVEAFLAYLERERGCSAATVNCRLAAIRALCSYACYRLPERTAQLARILDIPRRREKREEVGYLTREEVGWLLDACRPGEASMHLMVHLLFSTGVRISELVGARFGDFDLAERGGRVRVFGKGRKERTLPLWPEVAEEVAAFAACEGLTAEDYLFAGRGVPHLTRSGARSRINTLVARASQTHPELAGKRIGPHTFRHSTAMAMLQSGVALSTIAIWLGHESVETTHKYMVADMGLKREALDKVHEGRVGEARRPYRPDGDILSFLEAL